MEDVRKHCCSKAKQKRRGPYKKNGNDTNVETLTADDASLQMDIVIPPLAFDALSTCKPAAHLSTNEEHLITPDYLKKNDQESDNQQESISQDNENEDPAQQQYQFDEWLTEVNELTTSDYALDDILDQMYETKVVDDPAMALYEEECENLQSNTTDSDSEDTDRTPLYAGAHVSIGAAMLLLALFTTSCNMPADKIELLLNIIGYLLPAGHILCEKYHEFKNFFKRLRNPIVKHYYCQNCLGGLPNEHVKQCIYSFCMKPISKASYFLEIPLEDQVRNLFAQKGFSTSLQHRFKRKVDSGKYEDIYDGKVYQSHFKDNGILKSPQNISFTMNTDGAPVFKSSKISIWPVYLIINELPYKQRMKRENMILASLWFGSQKPPMATYLKPLRKSMENLYKGFECVSPDIGSFICQGILLCCTADLPARSMLCNHIQYNGAFSCWKCEDEGITTASGKGYARVYPFNKDSPTGTKRTMESVVENARSATTKQTNGVKKFITKGIKGPSWLIFFPKFNIVDGVAIDYMHGVLLGVQKQLLELWFSRKYSSKPYSYCNKVGEVDRRLTCVTPTLDITRLPRSIEYELQHWKASEYRAFLLFFGAPVLNGILNSNHFSHYLLLVESLHILLKCGSTEEEITRAENMLIMFCKHMETLYDISMMRLNVHQLLHLADSVRKLGPLYTHSCFSFEDKNGYVMRMIKGTQSVDNQIVTGISFVQKLPELVQKFVDKDSQLENLYHALESPHLLKRNVKLGDGIYSLGGVSNCVLSNKEMTALQMYLGHDPGMNKFLSFSRILFHQDVIYGQAYTRMTKRDNSAVEYTNMDLQPCFGNVLFFVQVPNTVTKDPTIAFIKKLKCLCYADDKNILSVKKLDDIEAVPLSYVRGSCMIVSFPNPDMAVICKFPNKMESD